MRDLFTSGAVESDARRGAMRGAPAAEKNRTGERALYRPAAAAPCRTVADDIAWVRAETARRLSTPPARQIDDADGYRMRLWDQR